MDQKQINRFFRFVSKYLDRPAKVILTGAAAGSLLGHIRPSLDIDFAIELTGKSKRQWQKVEGAIAQAQKVMGIPVNYAQDIDRWGAISLLDYRRHIRPYRSFGKLQVTLLDPAYWTIGKMTRFLDSDIRDIAEVISKEGISSGKLIRLWAKALRASPRSTASLQFRQHVEFFLRRYGKSIWGKRFNRELSIQLFHTEAALSQVAIHRAKIEK